MKIFTSIVLLFSLCIISASAHCEEVGRYQLFQGEYRFINLKGEESWSKALFELDTASGKIFICGQDQVLGKYINKPGEAYQRRYCEEFDQEIQVPTHVK